MFLNVAFDGIIPFDPSKGFWYRKINIPLIWDLCTSPVVLGIPGTRPALITEKLYDTCWWRCLHYFSSWPNYGWSLSVLGTQYLGHKGNINSIPDSALAPNISKTSAGIVSIVWIDHKNSCLLLNIFHPPLQVSISNNVIKKISTTPPGSMSKNVTKENINMSLFQPEHNWSNFNQIN